MVDERFGLDGVDGVGNLRACEGEISELGDAVAERAADLVGRMRGVCDETWCSLNRFVRSKLNNCILHD